MEGTGHCAVGSVVGVNNAQVAGMLGASMILIANGGLGSAFDELGKLLCAYGYMQLSWIASYCDSNLSWYNIVMFKELNRVLCEKYNVPIAGVVINKVIPNKYDQTKQ